MSAYYKYGTATTTGPWPDDIAKKPMTGKRRILNVTAR